MIGEIFQRSIVGIVTAIVVIISVSALLYFGVIYMIESGFFKRMMDKVIENILTGG